MTATRRELLPPGRGPRTQIAAQWFGILGPLAAVFAQQQLSYVFTDAARRLHEQGVDVVVLEARDRIGGRIHTLRDDAHPDPIEIGAEFVHGSAPELTDIAEEAGLRIVDITGRRWESGRDRWRRADD